MTAWGCDGKTWPSPLGLHVDQGANDARPGQGAVRGGLGSVPVPAPHGLRKYGRGPCHLEVQRKPNAALESGIVLPVIHATARVVERAGLFVDQDGMNHAETD